ncbi:CAMK family protein kinase [Tritrichomonas foetus]|uniref:CAMK family protein kinase n=1 Tax=Tritrichomonas foetus TaxID=1144522 RepID=A0A1J4JYG8_9EUKA|nr:CAMK family protein kinase [Tritrichomonas foetus]|eukprot:OHT02317.1 CAMK family protein kinase [Tritrichomonas foetus]
MTDINLEQFKTDLLNHGYTLGEQIGKGGFSTVYLVFSKKYNVKFVAKRIKHVSDECQTTHQAEIENLMGLPHHNIIKIYEYFYSDGYLVLILEYCELGCLETIIQKEGALEPPKLYHVAYQIADAIKFCHDCGVAHSDIKPSNILVDKYGRPKLIDFGLSQKMMTGEKSTQISGSLPFMSPELINRNANDPFACDIWALGITFFFMAYQVLPWASRKRHQIKLLIEAGEVCFPSNNYSKFSSMIKKMLNHEPHMRPKIDQVLIMLESMMEGSSKSLDKKGWIHRSQMFFKTGNTTMKIAETRKKYKSEENMVNLDQAAATPGYCSSVPKLMAVKSYMSDKLGNRPPQLKVARRRLSLSSTKTFLE